MTQHRESTTDSDAVRRALVAVKTLQAKLDAVSHVEPIAVVGIGCRFPQADGREAFWRLLHEGVDAVTEIPPDRWDADSYCDPDPAAPGKMSSRWGAFLETIDRFDAHFFGIAPREAAAMDPQQRLLLEVAWEALEDAGQRPADLSGTPAGVFVGISTHDYGQLQLTSGDATQIDAFFGTGNMFSVAAGRISYVLGLRGPSIAIDTACSSSLVSVHLACQSLRTRESDLALAGGVNLMIAPESSIAVSKYHALAPDGRCKAFDARANGFVRGEGCGLVVLKRWSDALANRDHVYGLIKGSAVNQDGRSAGLTAPSEIAQVEVIRAALERAGVSPEEISYVEAHGTGTSLGDPIEVAALAEVFRTAAGRGHCGLGSVKTNLGHLEAAAGIAGLTKVLLALEHEEIPPHLHLRQLNPRLSLDGTPFAIPTTPQPWRRGDRPRVAAISSFGLSGTNAHAVIEEPPRRPRERTEPARTAHLLTLSARSPESLADMVGRYEEHVERHPDVDLGDLAYTANVGRARFPHRLAIVARSSDELRAGLSKVREQDPIGRIAPARAGKPKVAFLFTGQGSQYPGMGAGLYATEPVFRRAFDDVRALAEAQRGAPLALDDRAFAAVAIFGVQHALVELWRSWGIEPAIVLGHSIGEYAAALAAGVWSLADATKVVVERTRLLASLSERGGMVAVQASVGDVEGVLSDYPGVVVAAINEPGNVVVSGALEELAAVERELQERTGVRTRMLDVSHAFHSPLVDGILDPFEAVVRQIAMSAPKARFLSAVTGGPLGDELCRADYWRRHLREPVRFADALVALDAEGVEACVEIGPAPVLLALAGQRADRAHVASLKKGRDDAVQILSAAGELFEHGIEIDFAALDRERECRRVPLPTYPFERERLWLDRIAAPRRDGGLPAEHAHPLLGRRVRAAVDDVIFETKIGAATLPFLADHRVHDRIVAPAAFHIALVLAALAEMHGQETACSIEQIVFDEALVLDEHGSRVVQIVLTPQSEGRNSFRICSFAESSGWRTHARGRVSEQAGTAATRQSRARGLEEKTAADYYGLLARAGIDLRARFRGVERLWTAKGHATGTIDLPPGAEPCDIRPLHPVLIDSTLQLLGAAVADASVDSGTWVPMEIERVDFWRSASGTLDGEASLQPLGASASDGWIGEAALFDGDGPLFSASGVLVRRAPRERFLGTHAEQRLLSHVVWRPAPTSSAITPAGRWLLLADKGGVGERLAAGLAARGHACVCFSRDEVESEGVATVLERALEQPPLLGIVDLMGLDGAVSDQAEPGALLEAQRLASGSMLLVAQALIERARALPLFFVTRGATSAGPSADGLAQAGMAALRRVLALEAPRLRTKLVDLDPERAQDVEALISELSIADGEPEVALRRGSRLVPRLAPLLDAKRGGTARFASGRTVLITGGLGALGLEVARFAIERGARSLVLASRSAPDARAAQIIDELRSRGAHVDIVRADVALEADIRRLLDAIAPAAPLGAVVHCAGVIDDAVITNQNWDRFAPVLAPKVAGAWQLHRATEGLALDAFVLFSSTASSIGSPGQANYACANAFLDFLAHYRTSRGLPALSINWGPWSVGMATRLPHGGARGVTPLTPDQALAAMGRLLGAGVPQATIADIDWNQLAGGAAPPLFAEVAARREAKPKRRSTLPDRLSAVRPAARVGMLAAHVRAEVARVLGVDDLSESMEALSFTEMGMSSLMLIELRNNLQDALGCAIPATSMFNAPTVASLASHLGLEVLGLVDADTSAPVVHDAAAADRIAALTEDEVADLVIRTIEGLE